jgi:hypothetical protein
MATIVHETPIIAVDFDGTICKHEFPCLGAPVPGAIPYMRKFQKAGARLILLTMRSEGLLQDAVDYCAKNGVTFWAINDNPEQARWTRSRKVYANIYIDDAAACCPLTSRHHTQRPWVDWKKVGPWVLREIGAGGAS